MPLGEHEPIAFPQIFLAAVQQRVKYVNRKVAVAIKNEEVSRWLRSEKCLREENVPFSTDKRGTSCERVFRFSPTHLNISLARLVSPSVFYELKCATRSSVGSV